jgi:hypothetical protein
MANWATLKLNTLFPEELRQASDAVGTVVSTLSTYLNLIRQAISTAATFSSGAATNPAEAALNAGLNEIQALVNGVISGSTVHAIAIPIQKQYYGRGVRAILRDRSREIVPNYDQLLESGAFPDRAPSVLPGGISEFINASTTSVGGNQGFWRALMVSIQDTGDLQRPLFPQNFAVAGACIIFGAQDLESLQPNFNLFNSLINAGERADLAAHTRPILRNLRGHVVTTTTTTGRLVVELSWDSVPPTVIFPLFSDEQFIATEIFVLRSEDSKLRSQFTWNEIFSRQPTDDQADLQTENGVTVVARITNDGFLRGYTDTSAALTVGTTYYYTTAIRYTLGNRAQPMSNFSNCIRVGIIQPQQSRASVPPDWIALPTLARLFPPLTEVTTQLNILFSTLRSRTVSNSGTASMLTQTATQLGGIVTELQRVVTGIQSVNTRIGALSTTSMAATSSTVFSVGSGGIDAWTAELARRLSDTSDSSRPPFDAAELVAGVVIVAGAPSTAQLETTLGLLEAFFGASETSPLVTAIASIETESATPTTVTFDASMSGTRAETTAATEAPSTGFDASLRATTTPEC